MDPPQPFVGIDVSSQHQDVDSLPASHHFSEFNTEDGIASLVLRLQKLNPQIVLLEATGGYEVPVAYALYMAALVASHHNPVIMEFYRRLRLSGKPAKVALTACMRKTLVILNAMLKNRIYWNPQLPLAA